MKFLLSEIAEICGGRLCGRDRAVGSVVTDSRSCAIGNDAMFVAISGVNHDAHNFVEAMAERGTRAFMVERDVQLSDDCGVVVVEDSLQALQRLALYNRSRFAGKVVAVTGSNGKTIVKEWIAQCAPASVRLFRSPRSYNSQLGVALSLLMLDEQADVAVIEAGISQRGEMARLEQMIRPDVVLFTSLGDAHQENFVSLEEKADEKLQLASSASTLIYHSAYDAMSEAVARFAGEATLVDAASEQVAPMADQASERNAQTLSAFCRVMGWERPDYSSLQTVEMRLEIKEGVAGSTIIDDSYNSDINSLAIALDRMQSLAAGRRKMLILSDILQSGLSAELLYERVNAMVVGAGIEQMIGIGQNISASQGSFALPSRFYNSTEEFLTDMSASEFADAVVLIKGNRGAQTERISHRLTKKSHTTVLEVNLKAMERNINYFRSFMQPKTRLVAMVKAASYGAGEVEVAQMLQRQGVALLAVAFADEGVLLREQGITMPIVVLNADEESFDAMVAASLEPEIYNFRSLEAFVRSVRRCGLQHYPVHLKFDTGMHRLGFAVDEVDALLARLDECADAIRVASVFTHLCAADDPAQDEFTRKQIALFDAISSRVTAHLPYEVLRHAAASAAIVRFAEAHFDMCRLGLGMYGFGYQHNASLEMVSTLRTRIVQIRTLDEGETVGYGREGRISRRSRIATIPVGYADGLDRHLGCGRWSMLVAGCKAPTIGRICMDSCMIDLTDIEGVEEGDEVTIFSPVAGNTPEDMAVLLDTIPYEVLTSVSKRVKRIYINE